MTLTVIRLSQSCFNQQKKKLQKDPSSMKCEPYKHIDMMERQRKGESKQ